MIGLSRITTTKRTTDTEEGKQSRDAFSHLRAAVAAKNADADLAGPTAEEEEDPYRTDLASVVKPRRPAASGAARPGRPTTAERPAPLKLVAEQRVGADEAEVIELCVAAGDIIEAEDSIVVLESDKASMDVEMTTIVSVRRDNTVVIGGDGQVSLGNTVMKGNARKVRRLYNGQVIAGFAGGTADAFTLFERFEAQLEKHQGNLTRAAVELAKDWRTDKYLQKLEALLIVAEKDTSLGITGQGDVLEPEHDVVAVGSGGNFAYSAARAIYDYEADAEILGRKAMSIAAEICVYTNSHFTVETLTK